MDKEVKELRRRSSRSGMSLRPGSASTRSRFVSNVPSAVMYEVGSYALPGATRTGRLARPIIE